MNSKEYKLGTLSPTKVTLTNWVRLTNAPLLLPRPSAVQWNEYVFVLVKDGTALLYHTKHGMWSVLPRCNKQLPSGPPPLTLHNGQVLNMSTILRLYTVHIETVNTQVVRATIHTHSCI